MNEFDEEWRGMLLGSVRETLAKLREAAEQHPRRPLSIAITKLEEAAHWLQDPSIFGAVNASNRL